MEVFKVGSIFFVPLKFISENYVSCSQQRYKITTEILKNPKFSCAFFDLLGLFSNYATPWGERVGASRKASQEGGGFKNAEKVCYAIYECFLYYVTALCTSWSNKSFLILGDVGILIDCFGFGHVCCNFLLNHRKSNSSRMTWKRWPAAMIPNFHVCKLYLFVENSLTRISLQGVLKLMRCLVFDGFLFISPYLIFFFVDISGRSHCFDGWWNDCQWTNAGTFSYSSEKCASIVECWSN